MSGTEERARAMGWAPKEEWRGDPENWKTAEEFLEVGENKMPVLKERLEKMYGMLENMQGELGQLRKTNTAIKEYNQRVHKKAYEEALETLRAEKRNAVANQDVDAYDRLEKEESRLVKESVENFPADGENVPTDNEAVPEYYEFLKNNSWYKEEPEMQAYANMLQDVIVGEGVKDNKEFFIEVERRVRKRFPEYFSNMRRTDAPEVEGGGGHLNEDTGAKTWANLPKEAKAAYQEHFSDWLSKDEYLKNYEW
jgi:hypothetical protein